MLCRVSSKPTIVTLLLITLMLAGCGAAKEDPTPEPATTRPATTGQVTLTIGIPGGTDGTIQAQQRLNDRLRQHPSLADVTIETIALDTLWVRTLDDYEAAVMVPGGPDIIIQSPNMVGFLTILGAVQPLNDSIPKHAGLNNHWGALYDSAKEAATFQGTIMGVPRSMSLTGMVYHRDYLDKAGVRIDPDWTWDDLAAVNERLQPYIEEAAKAQADPRVPAGVVTWADPHLQPISFCTSASCWLPLLWSNGGEYIDRTTWEPAMNTAPNAQALTWLQQQVQAGHLGFAGIRLNELFNDGLVAMMPGGYANAMTSDGKLGVAPWPRSPFTGESITMMGISMYVVNPHTANMPVVLDFLSAALSVEGQTAAAHELSALPVRDDAAIPRFAGLPPDDVIRRAAADARPNYVTGLDGMFPAQPADLEDMFLGHISAGAFLHDVEVDVQIAVLLGDQLWWRKPRDPTPSTSFFGGTGAARRPEDQEPPGEAWEKAQGTEIVFLANTSQLLDFIEEFNRSQNDIYVRFTTRERGLDYDEALEKYLADDTVDVVWLAVPNDMRTMLMDSGALLPLDRLLATSRVDTGYDYGLIDASRHRDGSLYAIPLARSARVIVARQQAWEQSGWAYPTDGWTWAEYLQWARQVNDPESGTYGAFIDSAAWQILAAQREPDMTAYPYPGMADDLTLFEQLHALFPPYAHRVQGGAHMQVTEGSALSTITYTSLWNDTPHTHPLILLPLPGPDPGFNMTVGDGRDYIAIAAGTDYPQQAFAFIAWLIEQNERVTLHPDRLGTARLPLRLTPQALTALEPRYGPHIGHIVARPLQQAPTGSPDLARDMVETLEPFMQGRITVDEALRRVEQAVVRHR